MHERILLDLFGFMLFLGCFWSFSLIFCSFSCSSVKARSSSSTPLESSFKVTESLLRVPHPLGELGALTLVQLRDVINSFLMAGDPYTVPCAPGSESPTERRAPVER